MEQTLPYDPGVIQQNIVVNISAIMNDEIH